MNRFNFMGSEFEVVGGMVVGRGDIDFTLNDGVARYRNGDEYANMVSDDIAHGSSDAAIDAMYKLVELCGA